VVKKYFLYDVSPFEHVRSKENFQSPWRSASSSSAVEPLGGKPNDMSVYVKAVQAVPFITPPARHAERCGHLSSCMHVKDFLAVTY
jgi:hypothetical protein